MIKEEEEVVCEADDAVEEAGDEREQDPEPDPIGLEDEDGVEEDFQLGRYIMCWDLLNLYKQGFGSIQFWRGSGSGSLDPHFGIVDPDPDPRIHLLRIVDPDPDPRIHLWK